MPENLKVFVEEWSLKGLGIGLAIGFVFEVFLLRNSKGKISWATSVLSVVAMGLMGWLSYDIARCAFPLSPWKSSVWTLGATANTWWFCRFAISGQMFKLVVDLVLPERMKKTLEKADDAKKKD